MDDETWTYADLAGAVGRVADRLRDHGVGPGDRVVMLMVNGFAFPTTDLAIMAIGAVKSPLNSMLTPAEVAAAVERVEPRCVVVDDELMHLASDVPPGIPRMQLCAGWNGGEHHSLPGMNTVSADAPAAVYLSGGTTGKPKGIVHSQDSVLHNFWAHLIDSGIGRDERLLLTTPLAHSAGLFTMAGILCGAHVRIDRKFDADRWLDLVDEFGITWSYGVPTMLKRIVDAANRRSWISSTLRTVQYGSAPMSPGLLSEALELFGPILQQLYAQTECPQYATLLRKDDHERALGEPHLLASAGRPTVMCEVTIRDGSGAALEPGEVGEVCLRSSYVMTSYWKDPEGYDARFHDDWLRTGDVGRMDGEGYVFLVDRIADMIISGGMNVYCIEVEGVLSTHPSVHQVAVFGIPDDEWGEAVHACIVTTEVDTDAVRAELVRHCRESLAAYKRPKAFEFVDTIPLTVYGKADKKAMKQSFWADLNRAIH